MNTTTATTTTCKDSTSFANQAMNTLIDGLIEQSPNMTRQQAFQEMRQNLVKSWLERNPNDWAGVNQLEVELMNQEAELFDGEVSSLNLHLSPKDALAIKDAEELYERKKGSYKSHPFAESFEDMVRDYVGYKGMDAAFSKIMKNGFCHATALVWMAKEYLKLDKQGLLI